MRMSGPSEAPRPDGMVAKFNGKCQDRCGLAIHAGHDEVERGHFGWRHVDCQLASIRAQVRSKVDEGWTPDEIWAWLERSESIDLNARIDAIFYAKVVAA